ncbi:Uncharacterised protein [Mycobacteroides abscessus subsp. abscessus]|nr:Uncharacterised protein [Mycobacteroides abscessus subsp. abscessus]
MLNQLGALLRNLGSVWRSMTRISSYIKFARKIVVVASMFGEPHNHLANCTPEISERFQALTASCNLVVYEANMLTSERLPQGDRYRRQRESARHPRRKRTPLTGTPPRSDTKPHYERNHHRSANHG